MSLGQNVRHFLFWEILFDLLTNLLVTTVVLSRHARGEVIGLRKELPHIDTMLIDR